MSKKITLYTINNCPYCVQAKNLLEQQGIEYQEIDFSQDKLDVDKMAILIEKSGMRTFPQIFCDDEIIGGFTELKALHDEKGLKNSLL